MTEFRIQCPKCQKSLKLQDGSMLGKKVRCPKCSHAFVLELPGAKPAATKDPAGAAAKSGQTRQRTRPTSPAAAKSAGASETATLPLPAATSRTEAEPESPEISALLNAAPSTDGIAQLRARRRRRARQRNVAIVCVLLMAGMGAGAWYYAIKPSLETAGPSNGAPRAPVAAHPAPAPVAEPIVVAAPAVELPDDPDPDRQPIDLHFVPDGARIIFHLRPAELWQAGSLGEEFRYCLGPLGGWIETKLKDYCGRDPQEIEEALICLIPGSPGTPPERSVVIRTVEKFRMSEMLKAHPGEMTTQYGPTVYVGNEHAYLFHDDLQTYAIGPRDRAAEMAESVSRSGITSEGIESLLLETDRRRSITMLFEPGDLTDYREHLFPPDLDPVVELLVEWINEAETEAVAWSIDLGDQFDSRLLVRNRTTLSEREMRKRILSRLDALPGRILEMVQHMQPREVGRRTIIGRFPAMLKVFAMTSQAFTGRRFVQVSTSLPERAAPNLAVGTLLTWDEATRTDFSGPAPQRSTGPKLPDAVVERLKKPVEIEFIKMPLQDAFAYLGDETKVRVDIDGDALKLSGYTKNMEQNISLGMAPAMTGIQEILKKYDQMVVVPNDADKSLLVTTKSAAQNQGLKPLEF